MESIILKNGNLVLDGDVVKDDILIENGKIVSSLKEKEKVVKIDCSNLFVCPGFIDIHCHFRDPGFTHKEDIFSGLKSAAAGGITAVCTMPNTDPVCDSPEVLKYQIEKAKKNNGVKLLPISSMTVKENGNKLVDFKSMKKAGAVGFSDDGRCIQNNNVAYQVAKEIKKINSIFMDHCEDYTLSNGGVVNEGEISQKYNLPPQNPLSEELIVARDILFSEKIEVKVHLQHISTKKSVELIKEAKKRGVKITCEVTPHHIFFSEKDIDVKNANFKMNPPLRKEEDRKYLIESILNGHIDVIASDHAPHTKKEKERGFLKSPFGIIGLETLIPSVFTLLYHKNGMDIKEIVKLCSLNPARVIGIERGIEIGKKANITIIDPDVEFEITENFFHSKSKNSPFIGKRMKGKAISTIVDGQICYLEK